VAYLVIIGGKASCYASTLAAAMRIAEEHIDENLSLRIEGGHALREHRAWVYDPNRMAWLEVKPQWPPLHRQ
jgi:hypothetical protein